MKLAKKVDVTASLPSKKLGSISEKRLALYGVAAGAVLAAGVSPAEATSITLDLTGLPLADRTSPSPRGGFFFDVNATSAAAAVGFANFTGADFVINNYATGPLTTIAASVLAIGTVGNAIAASFRLARRFAASNSVGPAENFQYAAQIAAQRFGGHIGNFAFGDTGFIGLRFDIGTDTHYGWANLTLNDNYTVTLNALGYETDPNTPDHIPVVPEGSSIVLLAIGAAGVVAFRRRQRKSV